MGTLVKRSFSPWRFISSWFSQRTKGTATLFYNEQVFLEPAIARHLHQDEIMSLPKIAPAQLHITPPTQPPVNPAATSPTQPPAKPAATCPTQPPANQQQPAQLIHLLTLTLLLRKLLIFPLSHWLLILLKKLLMITSQNHLAQKPNDHFPMPSANFSICQSSSPITQQPDKPNTSSQESDLTPTFSDDDFTTVR